MGTMGSDGSCSGGFTIWTAELPPICAAGIAPLEGTEDNGVLMGMGTTGVLLTGGTTGGIISGTIGGTT